jgi:hypothetical protein
LLLLILGFRMKNSSDFWGIKKEIKYFALMILLSLLVFSFNVASGSLIVHVNAKHFVECLTTFIALLLVHIPSLTLPLKKAEKERRRFLKNFNAQLSRRSISEASSIGTRPTLLAAVPSSVSSRDDFFTYQNSGLLKLLQNSDFEELFYNHLQSEFSLENLIFMKRAHSFFLAMSAFDPEDRIAASLKLFIQEMLEIKDSFLLPTSPYSINLPGKLLGETLIDIKRLSEECQAVKVVSEELWMEVARVFRAAANDVLGMLEFDSFKRFKKTKEFNRFQNKQIAIVVVTTPQSHQT